MRVTQEFYCSECSGYFLVRLNMALNHEAHIVCPNCGHEHRRAVVKGEIHENGRFTTDVKERILSPKSTYRKDPHTQKMQDAHSAKSWNGRRDGVVLDTMMMERWLEKQGREEYGD